MQKQEQAPGSVPPALPKRLPGFLSCLILLSLTGCTTLELRDLDGEHQRYLGWVSIEVPQADANMTATRAATIGLALADGLSLGWSAHERIAVPLADPTTDSAEPPCSMVVIIRSRAEAEYLRNLVNQLQGVELCYVSFTE